MKPYHYAGPVIYDPFANHSAPRSANMSDRIMAAVCEVTEVSESQIAGLSRLKQVVSARKMVVAFNYALTDLTYSECGQLVNRDHATAIFSRRQLLNHIATEDHSVEMAYRVWQKLSQQ